MKLLFSNLGIIMRGGAKYAAKAMVVQTEHEKLGTIVYEESFWTGRKKLSVNGLPCERADKRTFRLADGRTAQLVGNYIRGVRLELGSESVQIVAGAKWYEYVLALLPLLFDLVWGNVPALFALFPMVGGALGALICALGMCLCFVFMRKAGKWWQKVLIALAVGAAAILICYAIALAILSAV